MIFKKLVILSMLSLLAACGAKENKQADPATETMATEAQTMEAPATEVQTMEAAATEVQTIEGTTEGTTKEAPATETPATETPATEAQ